MEQTSIGSLGDEAARQFEANFGAEPEIQAIAPGRVNVIGEHTDYNGGFVLPMAIERYTLLAARQNKSHPKPELRLYSLHNGASAQFDLSETVRRSEVGWANYVLGVVAGFQRRGLKIPSLDVLIHTNVPLGGGLSSSAALEVATATLLEEVTGRRLTGVEKALLCQKAEHEFAGVPCGIMDQFISVMGKKGNLLLLDCLTNSTEMVPMNDPAVSVLIVNSNVRHELTGGEYAERRAQCETAARILGVEFLRNASMDLLRQHQNRMDPLIFQRARHVIKEIARTQDAAQAIRNSQWEKAGQFMYESHRSLRDDFQVSCEELDLLVDLAGQVGVAGGVYGSRMTGGGFGGCTVSLARTDKLPQIQETISQCYKEKTGIDPGIFVSQPAEGAHILSSK